MNEKPRLTFSMGTARRQVPQETRTAILILPRRKHVQREPGNCVRPRPAWGVAKLTPPTLTRGLHVSGRPAPRGQPSPRKLWGQWKPCGSELSPRFLYPRLIPDSPFRAWAGTGKRTGQQPTACLAVRKPCRVLPGSRGHPLWLSGKASALHAGAAGDCSSIPGSGRSPGGGFGSQEQRAPGRGNRKCKGPGAGMSVLLQDEEGGGVRLERDCRGCEGPEPISFVG